MALGEYAVLISTATMKLEAGMHPTALYGVTMQRTISRMLDIN
jgi:malonyl CoA-acyl carrier protein transacylase